MASHVARLSTAASTGWRTQKRPSQPATVCRCVRRRELILLWEAMAALLWRTMGQALGCTPHGAGVEAAIPDWRRGPPLRLCSLYRIDNYTRSTVGSITRARVNTSDLQYRRSSSGGVGGLQRSWSQYVNVGLAPGRRGTRT